MKEKKNNILTILELLFIVVVTVLLTIYFRKTFKNIDTSTINNTSTNTTNNIENNNHKVNKTEFQDKIINNTTSTISDELRTLFTNFFNTYYRSMMELKEYDMTEYFLSNSKDSILNQTSLEVLIESRKRQLNDLSLKDAKYDLTITKATNKNNSIYIELLEDSYIDFAFLNYTSKVYNILNTFEIVRENDEYKIKSYYKEQGHFIMLYRLLDSNKDYNTQLTKLKNNYIDIFDKEKTNQEKLYESYLSNKDKTFKKCDHKYDREKAIEYALKYVNSRDPNVVEHESNCQNYASWVMYHGGIPMDYKGNYLWSYNKNDKTATWTAVGYFYTYAKNNTGYGLCSEVDVNPYYAQKGDIIQVGYNDKYRHTAVVIDTFKKDDNVIDIILSSNTGDLEYYPLSAYVYPEKRLIKILGYNEK